MSQNNGVFIQTSSDIIAALYEMSKGSNMLMVQKLRRSRFRTFSISTDLNYLRWRAAKRTIEESSIRMSQITQLREGQKTDTFENCNVPKEYKALSFSVIYSSQEGQNSLDIVSNERKEYDIWLTGLKALISGVHDKEFIQEQITNEDDAERSVRSIVSKIENRNEKVVSLRYTSMRQGDKTGTASLQRSAGSSCDMYTWGDGTRSMLGHGEEIEEHRPRFVDALSTLNIKLVCCGAYHTLCVTASGETLSWGAGSKGQLGQGHLRDRFTPLLIEGLYNEVVVQISCAEHHSTAVTEKGKLYTWGYGGVKLGYEALNDKQLSPRIVESLEPYVVVYACCGKDFTLACTSDCQVFAFGNNNYYQLGLGHNNAQREPALVEFENSEDDYIIQVSCGEYHCAALSESGNIWTWGLNDCGQLGMGDFTMITKPWKLKILRDNSTEGIVTDVSCGKRHTGLVTFGGVVYCFGDNSYCQLGRRNAVDGISKYNRPEIVKFPPGVKVKTISCGAYHNAAISECGEIFTWGNGSDGQLGHGDDALKFLPTQITECFAGKLVTSVSCGSTHTACTAAILPRGSGVKNCMGCHVKLSQIIGKSRYYCDSCGGTFCSSCAPKRPRRLCEKCFKILNEETSEI